MECTGVLGEFMYRNGYINNEFLLDAFGSILEAGSGNDILNWRKKRRRQQKVIASSTRMRSKRNFTMVTFLKEPMLMSRSCSVSSHLRNRRDSTISMVICPIMDARRSNRCYWHMTGATVQCKRLKKQLRRSGP
jgi:hypothetical protein